MMAMDCMFQFSTGKKFTADAIIYYDIQYVDGWMDRWVGGWMDG